MFTPLAVWAGERAGPGRTKPNLSAPAHLSPQGDTRSLGRVSPWSPKASSPDLAADFPCRLRTRGDGCDERCSALP